MQLKSSAEFRITFFIFWRLLTWINYLQKISCPFLPLFEIFAYFLSYSLENFERMKIKQVTTTFGDLILQHKAGPRCEQCPDNLWSYSMYQPEHCLYIVQDLGSAYREGNFFLCALQSYQNPSQFS